MAAVLRLVMLLLAFAACLPARADEMTDELARVRASCTSSAPAMRVDPRLSEAARRVAQGFALRDAVEASGYRAKRTRQWSLRGFRSARAAAQYLGGRNCAQFGEAELVDLGVYQRGDAYWIVAAAPLTAPAQEQAGEVAERVLALVNRARSQARRCGAEAFAAARPLALDARLGQAATVQAQAMARGSFLEHQGRDGSTPASRISGTGYDWRSVGENIAMGQSTPEQVVADWVKSPEHCANIMDPRFTQMGVAFAFDPASEGGVYWAQTFGAPR